MSDAAAVEIDRHGLECVAAMLEIEVARRPDNVPALATLSEASARLGRRERSLALDRQLARLEPRDATVRYNLACSLALLGECAEALRELELAIGFGFADADHLESDEDLSALRRDPRFQELVGRLRARSR